MKQIILTFLTMGFILNVFSQAPDASIPVNVSSTSPSILQTPLQGLRYRTKANLDEVSGSPLLYNDWRSGEVTLKNGEVYEVNKINMDASRNKFIYMKNDTTYEFTDNIRQLKIKNPETGGVDLFIKDIDSSNSNFAQVLVLGKVTIFQFYSKLPEGENYSNGIVENERKYVLHTTVNAILKNKEVIPITKYSSAALDDILADKKSEVDTYLKENNLKIKKENDFLKVVSYYNEISGSSVPTN